MSSNTFPGGIFPVIPSLRSFKTVHFRVTFLFVDLKKSKP